MIGRNDPCLCGSGKKYKKCCEKKQAISVETVQAEELERILQTFYDEYPDKSDVPALLEVINKWKAKLNAYLQEEMIEAISIDEFFFHEKPEIWGQYIEKQQKKAVRPAVLSLLEKWKSPDVIVGEVIEVETDYMLVKDILSNKTIYLRRESEKPVPTGVHLFSFILPDISLIENHYLAVSSLVFIPTDHTDVINEFVKRFAAQSDCPALAYMKNQLLEFWLLLCKDGYKGGEFTNFEANVLSEAMDFLEKNGRSSKALLDIMEDFLIEQQPNARKEVAIAAGAIRFGQEHELFDGPYWSIKDIAERFKVSTSTLNKYYVHIEEYYERTMDLVVNK
ncbi:MAG: SEC-C metal-binding domain-containing protein [Paenisporosarcina sp.]